MIAIFDPQVLCLGVTGHARQRNLRVVTRSAVNDRLRPANVTVDRKRHGGRILVGSYCKDSQATSDRERGTLAGVACESLKAQSSRVGSPTNLKFCLEHSSSECWQPPVKVRTRGSDLADGCYKWFAGYVRQRTGHIGWRSLRTYYNSSSRVGSQ